jgi:hypothetical protein
MLGLCALLPKAHQLLEGRMQPTAFRARFRERLAPAVGGIGSEDGEGRRLAE